MARRDKNFVWRRVDARSLDLKGMRVAIVGGTGGIGRALNPSIAWRGCSYPLGSSRNICRFP